MVGFVHDDDDGGGLGRSIDIRHIPSFQWYGLDSVTFEGFKSIRTNTIDGFMTLIQTHSSTANEWSKSSSSLATLSSTLLLLAQVAPSELLTTEGDETGEWMACVSVSNNR